MNLLKVKFTLFILCILLFSSCKSLNFPSDEVINERELLRSKRSYIGDEWATADPLFDEYFGEMIKDVPGANYYPVWFNSIGYKMNGIILTPETPSKGTVLLIHGFAGNLRGYRSLSPKLLEQGYTIAALTLPGHGLAGGPRGDISNFNDYGIVISDFLEQLDGKVPKPYSAVAHSTGCSALLIYDYNYGWEFEKVVFLAPLVRSNFWNTSLFIRFLTKPFLSYYNTSWTGPLAVQVFPMHWLDELKKWNKELKEYPVSSCGISIFQGNKDEVVEWKYNTKFLMEKYPNSSVIIEDGGSHTFFFKNEELNTQILNDLNGL